MSEPYIRTYTGKKFYPLDPRAEDVDIRDIAHALANCCRFNGHTRTFYSVAQHSVLVSAHVPPAAALWGLLHDASEAYLADVPSPIKPHLPGYVDTEHLVACVILNAFGISHEAWRQVDNAVHKADAEALCTEARDLMGVDAVAEWNWPVPPWKEPITPLSPKRAEYAFLAAFEELTGARGLATPPIFKE